MDFFLKQWVLCFLLSILFSTSIQAALFARDLDGDFSNGHEAVYDDVLDVTWLRDANLAASNNFGVSGVGLYLEGDTNWFTALAFIDAMNEVGGGAGHLGVNTWRLPTVTPVNGGDDFAVSNQGGLDNLRGGIDVGYHISAPIDPVFNPEGLSEGFTGSELAYHYYNNLGGKSAVSSSAFIFIPQNVVGTGNASNLINLALFTNIAEFPYWTDTDFTYANGAVSAFVFDHRDGNQYLTFPPSPTVPTYVWAVADGDVAAAVVPLPASAWLFLSALGGLLGLRATRRTQLEDGYSC